MTIINNQEDFLQALRDNPEWREAVRLQILGEELLKLPANFSSFAAAQVEFNNTVGQRLDRLEEGQIRLEEGQTRLEQSVEALARGMNTLIDDVGLIKGIYARNLADLEAADIAENMGYEFAQVISREELRSMSRQVRDDYSANRLLSFRRADLVIIADSGPEKTYIAVEVSFTADTRDTGRAISNAEILTRVTGLSARAAVAGVRYTREVQDLIEQGQIYWHDLKEIDLQPE
jgi:hypothetical protein